MPAEKGIPKPEASARRLDVRNYDSREAWGWLSEDERLIMSKEGVAYVDVELVCLKFDEFLKEYKLSIHQIDGKRLLRCCLLYTSPSPRDGLLSRMPSSA